MIIIIIITIITKNIRTATNRRNDEGNKMTKLICNSYEKKKGGER
jgi:hypothetical protein